MPVFVNTDDFLSSYILKNGSGVKREFFDPENKEHRDSLKIFIETGKWGKVHFFAEQPYYDVPSTVLNKFTLWSLTKNE